jgi:peroxin-1
MVQKQESDFSLKLSEENPSLKVPDELRNIPLRIGALISLPFTSSTLFNCAASFPSSHRCLYRLIVTDNTDHTEAVDNDDEEDDYVFTQDVVDLLRLPGVESAQCEYLREAAIDGIDQTDVLYSSCPNVRSSSALSSYGLPNTVPSTLVYGEIGSGKTYTALLLAAMSHLLNKRSITYLDCRRLKNTQGLRLEGIMDEILFAFQHATAPTPSVIILDDLDELVPHTETDHSSENRNVQPYNPTLVDQCHALAGLVRHLLRSAWDSGADLKVVITAKDPECLSGSVRDDLMDTQLARLPLLSEKDRIELFHAFLDRLGVQRYDSVSKLHDPGVTKALGFGPKTTGFRPLDLLQLAERLKSAFTSYVSSDSLRLLEKVLRDYVPLSQRAALIEYIQHEYSMDDVGGLLNAKQELATTMLRPARYRRIYQHADLRLPRGILLFGPPGCGKSFVVPALAGECGYPLIMCRGAELLDKYIGASEMKVRELFSRAASVAPSLLWLDELDALAPRRGSDSTGVTDRIVNQLLTLLDGVEDTSVSGTIYVVGTSSRPDKIDPALLRPGRLERHVYVGLPESVDELKEVLIKLSEKFSLSEGLRESLHSGEFLAVLNDKVKDLKLLSPADARAAFVSAQIAAARAAIDEGVDRDRQDQVPTVTAEQLLEAFRSTRPSIGQADRTMLDAIYSNFRKISSRPTGQSQANIVSNDLKVALM